MGSTRHGLKPCHRPLLAALAEAQLIAGYWLRSGNTACIHGAAEILRHLLARPPKYLHLDLIRAEADCSHASVLSALEEWASEYVMATRIAQPVQSL